MTISERQDRPLLDINNLEVAYGKIEALKGISLSVYPGEICTLVGSNGAGKTTLLRTISGLLQARSGTIAYAGEDLTRMPADRIVRRGIAHSPEGRRVFATLTVEENLNLGAFIHRREPERIAETREHAFELFPRLRERRNQLAGTLSGGEQQMLAIGRALMTRPELLLLDEPSLGLAPILVNGIFETISAVRDQGVTILLVEQNARMALRVADRAYVLETGHIKMSGTVEELRNNPEVIEAYFGG